MLQFKTAWACALTLIVVSAAASAQTTWTGAISTSWDTAGNWNPAAVPTGATNVVIASAANQPSSYIVSPSCNNLTIQNGATLTLGGGFDLTVNGSLLINAGGTLTQSSATSEITVAGTWSNSGTFNNGGSTVEMTGTGNLGGLSTSTFQDLVVSGGTRTSTAAWAVSGDVAVEGGATFNLGTFTHQVAGSWASGGPGVSVTGTGTLEFTGNGLLTTVANPVPNVLVSAGLRSVNPSTVAGDLELTGGTLMILDNATLSVGGNATLSAGTLGWTSTFAGLEVLDVDGDVDCSATSGPTSADVRFRCGGNWTSGAGFVMADGIVELDGGTTVNVGGTTPTFPNLRIASGAKTVTTAITVVEDLSIDSGATLTTNAALDVDGDVTLGNGTSAWNLGAVVHTVAGGWVSSGGSATGAGTIRFDGSGNLFTSPGTIGNVEIVGGTRTVFNATATGNLSMTGGALDIANDGTLAVGGDLSLTAGTLNMIAGGGGPETIDVAGDVTITAVAGTFDADSRIACGGDWLSSAAFTPAGGLVTLDGAGAHTVSGAGAALVNLTVAAGTRTVLSELAIAGNLTVSDGATLDTDAPLDVGGNVVLGSNTAAWDMGSSIHKVAGNFQSGGAAATGTGRIEFDGSGTMTMLTSGGASISNVRVTAGTRTATGSGAPFGNLIANDLEMTGGSFVVADNSTVTVNGDVSFSGGTFSFNDTSGGFEIFDVAGNATITAASGTTSANTFILCAGNWSSSSNFSPNSGFVILDGGTVATLSGTDPEFATLQVISGTKTVSVPVLVKNDLVINSGGTLTSGAVLDVNGGVILGNVSATWDLGALTHTVENGYSSGGANAIGTGTVEFDGSGNLSTGAGTIANVLISGGTRTVDSSIVFGDLEMTGGTLTLNEDAVLSVAGDLTLSAGTLNFAAGTVGAEEVIDVAGNATVTAAAGVTSGNSVLQVAGDFATNASFAPSAGRVEFDGVGTNLLTGAAPTNDPTLADVVVASGTRQVTVATTIGGDLTVASGATLDADAPLDVNGLVSLGDATSTWDLGDHTHTVSGSWDSTAGGVVAGTGTIEFDANGSLATDPGTLPNVLVSAGTRVVTADTTVTGNVSMTGGELRIFNGQTLTVGGDLDLTAGTLAFQPTANSVLETIDVAGDVTITAAAGSASSDARLFCAGNWSSSSAFTMADGTVALDGALGTTIGGAGAIFPSLEIDTATRTALASFAVAGDFTLNSGGLDLGASTMTVSGDWDSSAGGATVVALTGSIEFDDDGTLETGANSIPSVLISAGQRTAQSSIVSGTLDMTGGELVVGDNQVLAVLDNVNLAAGMLSFDDTTPGIETLDCEEDFTITATAGSFTANSLIQVANDWSSTAAFAPTAGTVQFDAGRLSEVSGTMPSFDRVQVSDGGVRFLVDTAIAGDLVVDSAADLEAAAVLDIEGDVLLGDNTSFIDLGAFTHTVAGDWISQGGSPIGSGKVEFDGAGAIDTGPGTIHNALVSNGLRTVTTSAIAGNLEMTGGQLRINDNQELSVGGTANLSAGTLSFQALTGGLEVLDVEGDLTITAAAGPTSPFTRIECAGNWSSTGAFAPAAGVAALDGGTVATCGGAGITLVDLEVSSGTKTITDPLALVNLTVSAGAALVAGAALDVSNDVTLGDGSASFDLGGLTHTVAGDWTSAGAVASNGTVQFDGAGQLSTGGGSIDNVTSTTGSRSILNSVITGNLELTGGALQILNDQTLSVLGDALLTAGNLNWFPSLDAPSPEVPEVLDVAGDVILTSGNVFSSPNAVLRCGGNWSSNGNFSPASGLVELDGGGTTTISGLAPGFDPTFFDLAIKNGVRQAANDLSLVADSIRIEAGAELEVAGVTVTVPGTDVAVEGTLDIGTAGAVAFGPTAVIQVPSGGTLNLIGSFGDPAVITGDGGSGYTLGIEGNLAASNFRFEQMSQYGVIVSNSRAIAPPPNDLRQGVFSNPSAAPNSVMLDIRRDVPTVFSGVDFEDPLAQGTFNVRVLTGAPITFQNSTGSLSGESFDHDPFNLVDWVNAQTILTSFTATPGPDLVTLDWAIDGGVGEIDTLSYTLERATAMGGPYSPVDTIVADGGPTYQYVDTTATPYVRQYYNLIENLPAAETNLLGNVNAKPWSAALPANILTVGPSGTFPTIQAALASGPLGGRIIRVETGTYDSFSVGTGLVGAVRILPAPGASVTIDTTGGPVTIQNVAGNAAVELGNMTIGGPGSGNAGLLVQNCVGVVVVDECTIEGDTGQAGVTASTALGLALQRTDVTGTPALSMTSSNAMVGKGAYTGDIDVTTGSRITTCEITGTVNADGGSTHVPIAGIMPDLDFGEFQQIGVPFNFVLQTPLDGAFAPVGQFFQLRLGFGLAYFDLQQIGIPNITNDCIYLQPLTGTLALPIGAQFTDATGNLTQQFTLPMDADFVGLALSFQFWTIQNTNLDPLFLRWSNVQSMIILP